MIDLAIIEIFRKAQSIFFITGAGISADSGIPTYRGVGGLYNDTQTEDGMPIEEALSGAMMLKRPEVCWKHIARIEAACRNSKPNRGHEVIAAFEATKPNTWVLTQNVDGLHKAAGSKKVIEIHGEVKTLFCMSKKCTYRTTVADYSGLEIPPKCPTCGSYIRPTVVLFGENLPRAAIKDYQRETDFGFDLVVSIGTTSVFPYIAYPMQDAVRRGVPAIEINPGETEISVMADHRIRMGAAQALGEIWEALSPGSI